VATARPPQRATSRACPYCRGVLLGRFGAVPDWIFATGPQADVFACASCGALVAGRLPEPDEAASWYSDYYTHDVEPARSRLWSSLWPTPRRRRELRRLESFMAPAGSRGRFLEVGTGSGDRLVEFASAGWDVVGQDLDPKAGEQARDRGITVHACSVVDLEGSEAPFDLIGLSHVVEHALDPAELLGACVALLAPGGRLCVISPNPAGLGRRLFGRWWYGLDQPRHLAVPTLESLRRVGAGLDLRVVEARSVSANAAVFLGSSLVRPLEERLPPGRIRRAARFATAFVGQGIGRAAVLLDDRLGEEIVWVGQRPSA
jgi:SAM-dependent methyltransferase